jgi:hypothetical protein
MYLRLGLPPLRPFPAAVAPWLQQAATSSEFFQVMLATLMLQAPQLWMGVMPLALQASFPAAAALGALFGSHPLWQSRGAPARAWLEAHKVNASGALSLGVPLQSGCLCLCAVAGVSGPSNQLDQQQQLPQPPRLW